jgi:3-phenylpropionate/trans-cinnamate dioxygenase ferredoxin reductase subunit
VPDASVDVLLIGGGVASAACAEELRAQGFSGSILLAGRELDPPYERPPCSKGYLRGVSTREDALYRAPAFYAEQGIDLRTRANVMKLDPAARTARVGKEEVVFDRALVATGANVRRLPVAGAELEGIHYLRALGNADAIRRDLEGAGRAVLVGGSYIGCEVAATLTELGVACTIVMQEELVLQRHFGDTAGRWFQDRLEERGVEIVPSVELAGFAGEGERVERVVLADGRELPADLVVMGTGAVPDVMLARSAGLELGETGGVRCDARLRTSAAGVWAGGDMCEYESVLHGRRLRVEHFTHAIEQGRTAARDMLGLGDSGHRDVPYFWSDLADWLTLEYVGPAAAWDEEELRGSLEDGTWAILYRQAGKVVGGLSVGRRADLKEAREAIAGSA